MTHRITHVGFFGDREHRFCLTDPMLAELERITGLGVGALYFQFVNLAYPASVLTDVIRLGLIGAGMDPEEAKRLCETYAVNRPLSEVFPLAFEVMDARWSGVGSDETPEDVARSAEADFERFAQAASGDLGASLSVAA